MKKAMMMTASLVAALVMMNAAQAAGQKKPSPQDARLRQAAERGDPKAVRALLAKGARAGAADARGVTALHLAAQGGHEEAVRLLIGKKAPLNARASLQVMFTDDGGLTPLHLALLGTHDGVARILVDRGADTAARPKSGESVFNMACFCGSAWLVERLLAKGAAVDEVNARGYWQGWSPLYIAAIHDRREAASALLKGGANANFRDDRSRTILIRIAEKGYLEMAGLLIARGADVNAKTEKGDFFTVEGLTPLHLAARENHLDMVNLMIRHGANVNALDANGNTPKDWAKSDEVTAAIAAAGGKGNPGWELFRAVEKDDYDAASAHLAAGADPNYAGNRQGYHSLFPAVFNGNEKMIVLLAGKGVDMNLLDASGQSPLHKAVCASGEAVVRLLIDKGADVNVADGGIMFPGETPLHFAARFASPDMVRLLVGKGARVNALSRRGETPLDCAAGEEMERVLVSAGGKKGKDVGR